VARRRRVTRDTRAYTHTRARARAAIEVWCGARAGIGFVLDWSSPLTLVGARVTFVVVVFE